MTTPSLRFVLPFAACCLLAVAPVSSPAQTAAPEKPVQDVEKVIELSPFQVSSSPDDGYRATNALSGTRFSTDLMTLPKPVDVITSEFLADIGALDLGDAVAYSTAITEANAAANDDITGSNFNVRGFNTFTTYRNGFRSFGIIDPINIDRIEVIKGPSSVFSGPIEPGGTINVITKRPSDKPMSSIAVRYATYDSKRVEASTTGPLNDSRTLTYRLATAISRTGYQFDFSGLDKQVIGGALNWKLSDDTTLSFEGQFVNNRSKPVATARPINNARTAYEPNVPVNFNRNGPDAYSNTLQYSGTLEGNHRLNHVFSVRAGLYYRYQDLERLRNTGSAVVAVSSAVPGGRLLNRQGEYEPGAISYAISPNFNLLGNFEYGRVKHRLILGYEYYYEKTRNYIYRRSFTGVAALNLNAPTYSLGDPLTYAASDLRHTWSEQNAFSFSNLFTLLDGRLLLLQGLRSSKTEDERKNMRPPVLRVQNSLRTNVPNYGASFKLRPDLAVFASYSESYLPPNLQGALVDADGNPFPPQTGKGTDIGVKFDLWDGRASGSVTAYKIDRENTLIPDPINTGFNISEGLTEVKGVDFSVALRPTKGWSILAGYSLTDGTLVNGTEPGGRIGNIPEHKATVWNRYKFSTGRFKGMGLGLGVIHVDERRGNSALRDLPGLSSPAYTLLNASVSYERRIMRQNWSFTLQANNLLDEVFYASAAGPGSPLIVSGTVRLSFR